MFQSNNLTIQQSKEKSFRVDPRLDPREAKRSASTNKGFTLIEVIIAIFLVTIGITATLLLITKTLGAMSLSFSQLKAAYLSQEGIEVIRNIRDTNWIIGGLEWNDLNRVGGSADEHRLCANNNFIYMDVAFDTETLVVPFAPGQCGNEGALNKNLFLVTFSSGTFYVPGNAADPSESNCTDADSETRAYTDSEPTPFQRYVEICYALDADNVEYMKIKSVVTWQAKGKDYEIIAEDHLYDWR